MTRSRFLPALSLALISLVLVAAGPISAKSTEIGPSVLVQLVPLRQGSLPHVVTAYGTVRPSPSARQTVTAPLSAKISALYVHQGEMVAKGAALLRLVPSPMTHAAYAQAEFALRVAQQLVARKRTLTHQHLATAQALAAAEKSEADAKATLAALEAEGASGPAFLRAPFRAIVTRLSTGPGAMVQEGAALLDLAPPGGLLLSAGVVPADAAAIHAGDKVTLTPLGRDTAFAGTVRLRGAMVEAGNGLMPVEIALPPGKAFPGEMLRADITTGEARGYVVPHAAILVNDHGDSYIVQSIHGIARTVAVRILATRGDEDAIAGKLDPRAPVILAGNHQLHNGMRVRVANPGSEQGR